MKVALKSITPNAEQTIVEIARVSSSRTDKTAEPAGLLNYLIKHKHWSPFEHGSATFEIECSKAIGIQLIRHRSFTFQEFSQRYQDVGKISDEGMFEPVELRRQATNNRQSSEEVFSPLLGAYAGEYSHLKADQAVFDFLEQAEQLYSSLLAAGVAREQARLVLPLATKTRIYMTGTIRSWIHFLELRDDSHAQKEAQMIAKGIKTILIQELPVISKALNWDEGHFIDWSYMDFKNDQ